jgi:WD40 repeat protein
MAYHLKHKSIITVSRDKTIRLWNIDNFDQNVEFTCPYDQPLCVAAHPELNIFACGFQSGTMRIFDIEKTSVAEDYTQFKVPVKRMAYAPTGDLLVTVAEDGAVALHNARRQHLPVKMMHLEFAPEFVHIAFSGPLNRHRVLPVGGVERHPGQAASHTDPGSINQRIDSDRMSGAGSDYQPQWPGHQQSSA